jgi:hypothetical protein
MVVAAEAGFAEATEVGDCESGCSAVGCWARQVSESNIVEANASEMNVTANISLLSARVWWILILFGNEKGRRRRFGDIGDTSLKAGAFRSAALSEPAISSS